MREHVGSYTVHALLVPIKNDLDFQWDIGNYAAAHPSEPGAIFLTAKFFAAGTAGADSQMGTVIHELRRQLVRLFQKQMPSALSPNLSSLVVCAGRCRIHRAV